MQHIKCQHSFSTMQEKYSYTVHPVITQNLIYCKKSVKKYRNTGYFYKMIRIYRISKNRGNTLHASSPEMCIFNIQQKEITISFSPNLLSTVTNTAVIKQHHQFQMSKSCQHLLILSAEVINHSDATKCGRILTTTAHKHY